MRTTLLGQFTLLWFIDALAGIDGVQVISANTDDEGADTDGVAVISANTDGLTLKVRRDSAERVKTVMTSMATESACRCPGRNTA